MLRWVTLWLLFQATSAKSSNKAEKDIVHLHPHQINTAPVVDKLHHHKHDGSYSKTNSKFDKTASFNDKIQGRSGCGRVDNAKKNKREIHASDYYTNDINRNVADDIITKESRGQKSVVRNRFKKMNLLLSKHRVKAAENMNDRWSTYNDSTTNDSGMKTIWNNNNHRWEAKDHRDANNKWNSNYEWDDKTKNINVTEKPLSENVSQNDKANNGLKNIMKLATPIITAPTTHTSADMKNIKEVLDSLKSKKTETMPNADPSIQFDTSNMREIREKLLDHLLDYVTTVVDKHDIESGNESMSIKEKLKNYYDPHHFEDVDDESASSQYISNNVEDTTPTTEDKTVYDKDKWSWIFKMNSTQIAENNKSLREQAKDVSEKVEIDSSNHETEAKNQLEQQNNTIDTEYVSGGLNDVREAVNNADIHKDINMNKESPDETFDESKEINNTANAKNPKLYDIINEQGNDTIDESYESVEIDNLMVSDEESSEEDNYDTESHEFLKNQHETINKIKHHSTGRRNMQAVQHKHDGIHKLEKQGTRRHGRLRRKHKLSQQNNDKMKTNSTYLLASSENNDSHVQSTIPKPIDTNNDSVTSASLNENETCIENSNEKETNDDSVDDLNKTVNHDLKKSKRTKQSLSREECRKLCQDVKFVGNAEIRRNESSDAQVLGLKNKVTFYFNINID